MGKYIGKRKSRKCPECQSRIEKNQGCNHMNCTICQTDFCWVCGKRGYPSAHGRSCTTTITDCSQLGIIMLILLFLPLLLFVMGPFLLAILVIEKWCGIYDRWRRCCLMFPLLPITFIVACILYPLSLLTFYVIGLFIVFQSLWFFIIFNSN